MRSRLKRYLSRLRKRPITQDPFTIAARQGDLARDEHRYEEGAEHYAHALAIRPDRLHLAVQMGHCLKETGQFNEARRAYLSYLNVQPEDPDIHVQIGHLEKLSGNKDAAIAAYSKAVELAGADTAIARDALQEIERLQAIKDFALFELGQNALRDRRFEESYQALTASINPSTPGFLAVLVGHACKETGRFEEARFWYEAQLTHATRQIEVAGEHWCDAIVHLAALEALEFNHLRAFRLFAEAANRLETDHGRTHEKVDEFWANAQRSLAKITRSISLI